MSNPFNPTVSIITPTYNHQAYLASCIDSVLAQTYPNWEQIIVDDGSSDETAAIAQTYAAQHEQIHFISHQNKGPARLVESYNSALDRAQGTLIAILEGDDFWPADKLATQVPWHADETLLMSYGQFQMALADGYRAAPAAPPFTGTIPTHEFMRYLLLKQSHMMPVTQIIRRDALAQINGFHQDGAPAAIDMATLLRLTQLPGNISYQPHLLGYWRRHAQQSTNLRGAQTAEHNLKLSQQTLQSLPAEQQATLGLDSNDLYLARRPQLAATYFNVARNALSLGERQVAYTAARQMWRHGGLKRRLQAIYAYIAAPLGLTYEPVLRWFEPKNS